MLGTLFIYDGLPSCGGTYVGSSVETQKWISDGNLISLDLSEMVSQFRSHLHTLTISVSSVGKICFEIINIYCLVKADFFILDF